MAMTRRDFVRGGVSAFTLGFAAPSFLTEIARAQGRSRRNLVVLYLSGGNDGLSTVVPYGDPQDFRTPSQPGDTRRQRAPDRNRQRRQSPRPQPATDRSADHLQFRPAGDHPADGLPKPEPFALSGHGHLVDGGSVIAAIHGVARALPGSHAGAGRSVDRLVHCSRDAAHAARQDGRHRSDPQRHRVCVCQPEYRRRRCRRAAKRDPDRVAHSCRSAASRLRQLDGAGGIRHARSRGAGCELHAVGGLSQQRLRAGAADGGRSHLARHRHEHLLGPDRWLRHALGAEHQRRQRLRTTA